MIYDIVSLDIVPSAVLYPSEPSRSTHHVSAGRRRDDYCSELDQVAPLSSWTFGVLVDHSGNRSAWGIADKL